MLLTSSSDTIKDACPAHDPFCTKQDGTTAARVSGSGMEAMLRYYEVSHQLVVGVGGEFVASGSFGGILMGDDEDWDAIGIVRYPDINAFTKVFLDPTYQACHGHRTAATLRHRMAILIEG